MNRQELIMKHPDLTKVEGTMAYVFATHAKELQALGEDENVKMDEYYAYVTYLLDAADQTDAVRKTKYRFEKCHSKLDVEKYVYSIILAGSNNKVIN